MLWVGVSKNENLGAVNIAMLRDDFYDLLRKSGQGLKLGEFDLHNETNDYSVIIPWANHMRRTKYLKLYI